MGKTDCRELLEVHRNVIDVKSIAFLVILLVPEDSFVTLHMQWHNRMLFQQHPQKNAICLSQSAFSNFAPHVIKEIAKLDYPHINVTIALQYYNIVNSVHQCVFSVFDDCYSGHAGDPIALRL